MDLLNEYFFSDNINLQKYALVILRQYFSRIDNYDEIVNSMSNYLIKRLITFLVNNNDLYLMFEACWVLINVAYVNKGGEMIAEDEDNLNNILKFIIRAKEDEDILHNALWLLKNLNSSSKKAKQFFFDNYILDFFEIIYDSYPTSDIIIDDIIILLNNLNRLFKGEGKEFFKFIPILTNIITTSLNITLKYKALNSLFLLSNRGCNVKEFIDELIAKNAHLIVIEMYTKITQLTNDIDMMENIQMICVKFIGNMLFGDDVQVQILINANVIDFLKLVLKENNVVLLKNAVWCVANIAFGPVGQIATLLKAGIIETIIQIGINSFDGITNHQYNDMKEENYLKDLLRETCFSLANVIVNSSFQMITSFINIQNCASIYLICFGLELFSDNENLTLQILEAIKKIVKTEDSNDISMSDTSYISILTNNCDIKSKLDRLQTNSNEKIANAAEETYEFIFDENQTDIVI